MHAYSPALASLHRSIRTFHPGTCSAQSKGQSRNELGGKNFDFGNVSCIGLTKIIFLKVRLGEHGRPGSSGYPKFFSDRKLGSHTSAGINIGRYSRHIFDFPWHYGASNGTSHSIRNRPDHIKLYDFSRCLQSCSWRLHVCFDHCQPSVQDRSRQVMNTEWKWTSHPLTL